MNYFYLQSNLSGHKNIIGYVDSSITHTTGGIHELLLLMPYCKSQVLQMMNNRLERILFIIFFYNNWTILHYIYVYINIYVHIYECIYTLHFYLIAKYYQLLI